MIENFEKVLHLARAYNIQDRLQSIMRKHIKFKKCPMCHGTGVIIDR